MYRHVYKKFVFAVLSLSFLMLYMHQPQPQNLFILKELPLSVEFQQYPKRMQRWYLDWFPLDSSRFSSVFWLSGHKGWICMQDMQKKSLIMKL